MKNASINRTMQKRIKELYDVLSIQGENGNWNYDPYMHGLYNGLEMAYSTITDKTPEFREAPKKWLYDKSIIERVKYWWMVRFTQTEKARE